MLIALYACIEQQKVYQQANTVSDYRIATAPNLPGFKDTVTP